MRAWIRWCGLAAVVLSGAAKTPAPSTDGAADPCQAGKALNRAQRWKEAEAVLQQLSCRKELGKALFGEGKPFDALVAWNGGTGSNFDSLRALAKLGEAAEAGELLDRYEAGCREYASEGCADIAAVRQEIAIPATAVASTAGDVVLSRLRTPRLAAWPERPLPKGASPISLLPFRPEIRNRSLVFAASEGKRALAVSVSGDVDPRGEVSRGGYWAQISDDGGKTFQPPLYLGFAEGYPYVVATRPRISPFDGDALRIEVKRREIDDRSVTFPPIAMRLKSRQNDLFLRVPIAELARDSDGDGLTDLLEEKIGSDARAADTDGDGLGDATDPQPLAARQASHDTRDDVLAIALSDILFHSMPALYIGVDGGIGSPDPKAQGIGSDSANRTVFVRSDRPLFGAWVVPVRTVVLNDREADAYGDKFGFTAMLRVRTVFSEDAGRALIVYDFGWQGGTILATKEAGGRWTTRVISSWIS